MYETDFMHNIYSVIHTGLIWAGESIAAGHFAYLTRMYDKWEKQIPRKP